MKNILLLSLIFSTVFLSSCNLIKVLSLDEINEESEEEITAFLDKKKIPYDYSLNLKDDCLVKLDDSIYNINIDKIENQKGASHMQLRVFDSSLYLVNGYEQCFGSFKLYNLLNQYPTRDFNHHLLNYKINLTNDIKIWDIDNRMRDELLYKAKKWEYTYVIYWSIWSKSYSTDILNGIKKFHKKFSSKNFGIILVNTAWDKKGKIWE